jgi:sterol desaturase/sphingolipid hydroxylase (fatty acid hydroxylase superfamily)
MRDTLSTIDLAQWYTGASTYFFASLMTLVALLIMVAIEMGVPHARAPSSENAWFNVRYAVVMMALVAALRPLALVVALAVTHAMGAGWITFAPSITGWCCAFLAVLVMTDLLEYLFHRAQHTFPVLWRMHEFHHSAEHFDVTLAYRAFWVEPLLKMTFLYPLVGIVFKASASVALAVGFVSLAFQYVAHMNLRFSPRRFTLLIVHPQYHRLHHSRNERGYNKNLCALLPLWDILFGTLRRPERDEFVDVGLESCTAPGSVRQALLWPWRRDRRTG